MLLSEHPYSIPPSDPLVSVSRGPHQKHLRREPRYGERRPITAADCPPGLPVVAEAGDRPRTHASARRIWAFANEHGVGLSAVICPYCELHFLIIAVDVICVCPACGHYRPAASSQVLEASLADG
jgi:hypothetical protein